LRFFPLGGCGARPVQYTPGRAEGSAGASAWWSETMSSP